MKKFLLALAFVALSSPAFAQGIKGLAQKNDLNRPGGVASATATTGSGPEDQIIAKINELGAKLIDDLQQAEAYASATDAAGQMADAAAAPCYSALIPVVQLVVNGPKPKDGALPPPAEPGIVTKVEKLRIIRIALQSTNLRNACAPLVQDVQTQVGSVLGMGAGIARIVTGLGLVP